MELLEDNLRELDDELTAKEDELIIVDDEMIAELEYASEEDTSMDEDVPLDEYSTAAIPPPFPHPISNNIKSDKVIFFIILSSV